MAIPDQLLQRLSVVEQRLDEVGAALVDGNSDVLQRVTTALRDASADFSYAMAAVPGTIIESDAGLQARVKRVGQLLASHRENLVRRSAGVDRALASLLPASEGPTYARAPGMGGLGAGRFGSRFS